MISSHERDDLIHIMKMNRFALIESDSAHFEFNSGKRSGDYTVTILVTEDLPTISIKQNRKLIYSDTLKSIDDLKIFLEEKFYEFLNV